MSTTTGTTQSEKMLGKYQLLERLGQGGMAQVYRAHQPNIERSVAIKVLHPHLTQQGAFVERFKREARSLGQLRHPHIVSVIDFDVVDDSYFMVMDFIEGPTLAQILKEGGALDPAQALLVAEQIADALSYAHERGTIHRDVKPANIMFLDGELARSASRRIARRQSRQHLPGQAHHHAVLADFGVARLLDDAGLTESGTVTGTPYYMSPEAANGDPLDARADIYSLGVVLYEMVTGDTPYKGDTPVRVMMQHVTEPLPPLRRTHPHLPEPVIQVIERALAKHPDARFENAKAMQGSLLQALLAMNNGHVPDTMVMGNTLMGNTAAGNTAAGNTAAGNTALDNGPMGNNPLLNSAGKPMAFPKTSVAPAPSRTAVLPDTPPLAVEPAARPRRPRVWEATVALLVAAGVAAGWIFYVDGRLAVDDLLAGVDVPGLALSGEPAGEILGEFHVVPTEGAQDLTLRVDAIEEPPAGQHYHLWLESTDDVLYNLGELTVTDGSIAYHGVAQQNVLGTLDRVLVTLESESLPAAPSDLLAMAGRLTPGAAGALDSLLIADELAGDRPLLAVAAEQIAIAQDHAALMQQSLDVDDLAEAQRHAEHVVNILDGESGERFGDLNLDGQAQNPGDGVGVRVYLDTIADLLDDVLSRADMERSMLSNAQLAMQSAMDSAQQITAADSADEAAAAVEQLSIHLHELLNGIDLDGSGAVEADRGEGAFLATTESVRTLSGVSLRRAPGSVPFDE